MYTKALLKGGRQLSQSLRQFVTAKDNFLKLSKQYIELEALAIDASSMPCQSTYWYADLQPALTLLGKSQIAVGCWNLMLLVSEQSPRKIPLRWIGQWSHPLGAFLRGMQLGTTLNSLHCISSPCKHWWRYKSASKLQVLFSGHCTWSCSALSLFIPFCRG